MKELVLDKTPIFKHDLAHFISVAKQRVDQLDAYRIQRALNNSSAEFQYVFRLLPILLHYNYPSLPAYVPNAPQGIADFQLSSQQQEDISQFSQQPYHCSHIDFDGLYMMGSIGSITQNALSDLDLWLCHSQPFSAQQAVQLQQKFAKLSQWGKSLGVDINFYLMDPKAFRERRYTSDVSSEHSGSAQHYFLLDEFYRSAVRLAGKRVLWLHLPETADYQGLVQQAVQQQIIELEDWIDFGDFTNLPLAEFFGASLWQLYKGIDHPYKSAIKILLLESYTATYPVTHLICRHFKKKLFANQPQPYHFDPYLAMLENVTQYLESRNEFARLECLRYCFYMKATDHQNDEWKAQQLAELALSWGWKTQDIYNIAQRSQWNVKQAVRQQKMLVEHLLRSYRNLINFARKFHIDPSIMPQDTDILMRKLYSVFEQSPGKVVLINQKIAKNLEEREVTFIEVTDNTPTKAGWYLVNHAPLANYDSTKRHVQYQQNLNELVAWAYFNGIITANTQLYIVSQKVSLDKLRNFITDLRLSFPNNAPSLSSSDLYNPNEIRNLNVAINLTNDPTKKIHSLAEISDIDLFDLSSSKERIIGSISLIYRNMWNEIITQHIEGHDAVLKALKLISNKIYRSSAPPHSVNVFCYSANLRKEVQKFMLNLVNRCITVQTGIISSKNKPLSALCNNRWREIFNENFGLAKSTHTQAKSSEICVPNEIYNFASEGFLQFFFADNPDGSFNVYVLDKQNKIEVYPACLGLKENKIKQISRLYAEKGNQNCEDMESFNYPQFYQLLNVDAEITIVPYQSRRHREYLSGSSIIY